MNTGGAVNFTISPDRPQSLVAYANYGDTAAYKVQPLPSVRISPGEGKEVRDESGEGKEVRIESGECKDAVKDTCILLYFFHGAATAAIIRWNIFNGN